MFLKLIFLNTIFFITDTQRRHMVESTNNSNYGNDHSQQGSLHNLIFFFFYIIIHTQFLYHFFNWDSQFLFII